MATERIDDGGPAFPSPAIYDPAREQVNPATAYGADAGMTLRDYFAAKALAGLLAGSTADDYEDQKQLRTNYPAYCLGYAESAYLMADAMLKARQS